MQSILTNSNSHPPPNNQRNIKMSNNTTKMKPKSNMYHCDDIIISFFFMFIGQNVIHHASTPFKYCQTLTLFVLPIVQCIVVGVQKKMSFGTEMKYLIMKRKILDIFSRNLEISWARYGAFYK